MTVAFDAATNGTSAAGFTHTPVGTPRGILVMVRQITASDQVTGVTYGGSALSEVALSPLLASGAEGGSLHGYFLGSSVPTGAQTCTVTVATGTARATCYSLTAADDTEVVNTNTIDFLADGSAGDVTGTLTLSGRTCFVAEAGWSATTANADNTPLTGWTSQSEQDEGSETNFGYYYNTVGSTDVTFGYTSGTDSDAAVLAVAVSEVAGGSTYTLDADSATYTYTATAAGLEFDRLLNADAASYTYTATAAGLEFDRQIAADAASYTYTASDAALEYDRQLVAESAAYLWTATDAALEYTPAASTYTLDADGAAYLWTASDAGFTYVSLARDELKYGAAPHTLSPARVRAKYEEIEEIDRRIKAKEEVQREKIRSQQEAKRQLAELQEKKRQTKTIAERRRKLEARIEAYQSEITDLRTAMVAMLDEIEEARRARVEFELQQTIADRRRRMLLLIAAAS
jgi:hypothetical protein